MGSLSLLSTVIVVSISCTVDAYVNNFKEDFDFSCPDGEHVSWVESYHDNYHEDRRWNFKCLNAGYVGNECWLSDYVNDWDGDMDFKCADNGIVTGFWSKFDSHRNDRRWKIRCCKIITVNGTQCSTTPDNINEYDNPLDWNVPVGQAIRGFWSHHKNRKEDRIWKVHVCSYETCVAKRMKILDKLKMSLVGTRVMGLTSSHSCNNGTLNRLTMGSTTTVTDTFGITITRGKTWSLIGSNHLSISTDAGFLGTGGGVTMSAAMSMGTANTATYSNTNTRAISFASKTGGWNEFRGPGATLMFGKIGEHALEADSVRAEINIECSNGKTFTEIQRVPIKQKIFTSGNIVTLYGYFTQGKCSFQTDECIANIGGDNMIQPQMIINQFHECFKGIGTSRMK
ncbi:uncharacterized protein LOC141908697 [Tubulanus polymorphus]|uniref:uncharacterized protein LOC141908697 n=1 Tax=Tubulanus polymorphus TaxID=672921 RepID=UPI003DA4C19B